MTKNTEKGFKLQELKQGNSKQSNETLIVEKELIQSGVMSNYITAYDPVIGKRVPRVVVKGYAVSMILGINSSINLKGDFNGRN